MRVTLFADHLGDRLSEFESGEIEALVYWSAGTAGIVAHVEWILSLN